MPHVRGGTQDPNTKKATRDRENNEAIGGMRNPARSVAKIAGLRSAGLRVRSLIENFCVDHPDLLRDIVQSAGDKVNLVDETRVDQLAEHIAKGLGAEHHRRGRRSLWRPGIVKAFVDLAGDPDTTLAEWLEEGAPTGVARVIPAQGIFPITEATGAAHGELWRHWAHLEPRANYASVDENRDMVQAEIDRLAANGFVTKYPSWAAVIKKFGNVVVSKMAAIVKTKEDGSTKLRLIIDMRRSHVNEHVKIQERIVLPRVIDMLQDTLALQGRTVTDDELDMIVLDWADAFHSMGVHPEEFAHQIVKGFGGEYVGYETVLFGGAGSPGVWGRAAAFLGRSGQSMFAADEVRIQVYVDDPWSVWRGPAETRARNLGTLLLWWRVLGPPISWKKVQVGAEVKWIGVHIAIRDRGVDLTMDPAFIEDLATEIENIKKVQDPTVAQIRKLAGKAEWAAGLIPYLKSMISPLWAALADAPHGIVARGRVDHALRWLEALLARRRGTMLRRFRFDDQMAEGRLVIDVDASPWGYGGVMYADGVAKKFFCEAISEADQLRFGIQIGAAKDQALLETIAVLIAVRLWLGTVRAHLWTVIVRTDSTAALGATIRMRSSDPRMNTVVRELALDLAEGRYPLDVVEHVAGLENDVADWCSRVPQPGWTQARPRALATAEEDRPAPRDAAWWETAIPPGLGVEKYITHTPPRRPGG